MATETMRELFRDLAIRPATLAERMGVGVSTVYAWLDGSNRPKPWTVAEIARRLKVDRSRLEAALDESRRRRPDEDA